MSNEEVVKMQRWRRWPGQWGLCLVLFVTAVGSVRAEVGPKEVSSFIEGLQAAKKKIDELLAMGDQLRTQGRYMEAENTYQQALEMVDQQGSLRQYVEKRWDIKTAIYKESRFQDLIVAEGCVEELKAKLRLATYGRYQSQFERPARRMVEAKESAQQAEADAEALVRKGQRAEAMTLWSKAVDEYNRVKSLYEAAHITYEDTAQSVPMRLPRKGDTPTPRPMVDEGALLSDAWNRTVGEPVLLGDAKSGRLRAIRRLSEVQLMALRERIDANLTKAKTARNQGDWAVAIDSYTLAVSLFDTARKVQDEMASAGLSATTQTQAWIQAFGGGEQEQAISDLDRTIRDAVQAKIKPVVERLRALVAQAQREEQKNLPGAKARYEEAAALSTAVEKLVADPAGNKVILTTSLPIDLTPESIKAKIEVMLMNASTTTRRITIESRAVGGALVEVTTTDERRQRRTGRSEEDLTQDVNRTQ